MWEGTDGKSQAWKRYNNIRCKLTGRSSSLQSLLCNDFLAAVDVAAQRKHSETENKTMCICFSLYMCTCVQLLASKLPKQISWRFTVTHVSPFYYHTPPLHVCVYMRDCSVSVCITVCLARGQHSTAASVWRQSRDIYSLVNTHSHAGWQRGETEELFQSIEEVF